MKTDSAVDLSARQLRAVVALARWRSFKAAAMELEVAQPALTRSLKQIERTLGMALFERTTRRVAITPQGREFVALAERVLADLRMGLDALRAGSGQLVGQVVVASVHSLATIWTTAMQRSFRERFPGVLIDMREGLQNSVLHDVETGAADFGIGYIDGAPAILQVSPLATERLQLVMPATSPYAARAQIDIAAVRDASLVSFPAESRTRRIVDGAAAAAGYMPRHAMTVNRLGTLLALVRQGAGMAVVPASEFASADTRGLTARSLTGLKLASRLGVLRLRERDLGAAALAVLEAVKASWRKQRHDRADAAVPASRRKR